VGRELLHLRDLCIDNQRNRSSQGQKAMPQFQKEFAKMGRRVLARSPSLSPSPSPSRFRNRGYQNLRESSLPYPSHARAAITRSWLGLRFPLVQAALVLEDIPRSSSTSDSRGRLASGQSQLRSGTKSTDYLDGAEASGCTRTPKSILPGTRLAVFCGSLYFR
jgi:hypothetical protein